MGKGQHFQVSAITQIIQDKFKVGRIPVKIITIPMGAHGAIPN